MPISLPGTSKVIADQILRDIRLAAIDAGMAAPPVHPGSDWDMLAQAQARVAMIGCANINLAYDDLDIRSASGDALDSKRAELGLPVVDPTGSSGKILTTVSGATTIVNGTAITLPNGKRAHVVGNYINPTSLTEIDAQADDKGSDTNFKADTEVTFVSPPINVAASAKVSKSSPLTGGTDFETDDRKRLRILNALKNRPAGGNWAHVREIAVNALGSIQDCFVYPTLGGPASCRAVPTKGFDRDNNDYSRAPSASALAIVRAAIQAQLPTLIDDYIQAAVDQSLDVALAVTLPASTLAGGNGTGWTDAAPWPPLVVADGGKVAVTVAGLTGCTVGAVTTTAPVALQTHIAWWSPRDRKFYTALVTVQAGGTGAWDLTFDRPLVDSTGVGPAVGDWICPAARNLDAYSSTWLDIIESMGPGENTADASRLPRALRHPFATDESPSALTADLYVQFTRKHSEMSSVATGYSSATAPTVPGAVSTVPSIFIPRRFGIYQA